MNVTDEPPYSSTSSHFAGPTTAWWKTLGSPVLTPEVQKTLIDSVHAEVGSRTIEELEAERTILQHLAGDVAASSLAKNRIAPGRSSGWPMRPSGIERVKASTSFSGFGEMIEIESQKPSRVTTGARPLEIDARE